MIKRNVPRIALAISLIVLTQLIGGIGCQGDKSESDSPMATAWEVLYSPVKWLGERIGYRGVESSSPLAATARESVYAQIKWLEEQKFEAPDPLSPIDVSIDSVQFTTTRIGRGGDANSGLSLWGAGLGGGGIGGGGGGGGGG